MGRTLLQEADARRLEDVQAKKKDRKKSKVEATDGEKVLDSQIRETLEDVSALCSDRQIRSRHADAISP